MNRMVGKRALIVAMTTGVLLLLFALVSTPGVLAGLITMISRARWRGARWRTPMSPMA